MDCRIVLYYRYFFYPVCYRLIIILLSLIPKYIAMHSYQTASPSNALPETRYCEFYCFFLASDFTLFPVTSLCLMLNPLLCSLISHSQLPISSNVNHFRLIIRISFSICNMSHRLSRTFFLLRFLLLSILLLSVLR